MEIIFKLLDGEDIKHLVKEDKIIIGRSSKCDVVIAHEGISRQHCEFEFKDGEIFITDLGSTNGVLINGEKITPHRKTLYATYFSLAFGPVQSVLINGDNTNTKIPFNLQKDYPLQKNENLTKTIALMDPPRRESRSKEMKPTPVKKTSDVPLKNHLINFVAILILAAAVWWYFGEEKAASPLPQEKSSAPSSTSYDSF